MGTYESWYRTTLALKLDPTDVTMTVATAPTVTSGRLFLKSWTQKEWISYTWVSSTTLTWLTRWLSQTADPSTAWTGLTWLAWTQVILVAMHDQLLDKQQPEQLLQEAKTYATTAARDSALWWDWAALYNYCDIKCTDTWLFYNYNTTTAIWEVQGNWVATWNASETAAWNVEAWTVAEQWAWTSTWWTWALLFPQVWNLVKTSSWAWDENKLAVLNDKWQFNDGFLWSWAITWELRLWTIDTPPTNWLIANWDAILRTTYAALFAIIWTTYWVWDWSTTFNIPDLRGNTPVGKDWATFADLWDTGWSETHTLITSESPAHKHGVAQAVTWWSTEYNIVSTNTTFQGTALTYPEAWAYNDYLSSSWWWGSHNNLQPYLVMNYIIKT